MYAAPGKGIQINGQCGDQRFAFTSCHFSDSARVQRVTANELHVERDHFPNQRMVADNQFLAPEAAAGILNSGECLRQDLHQFLVELFLVLDFGEFGLTISRFLSQRFLRQRLQRSFDLIDLCD